MTRMSRTDSHLVYAGIGSRRTPPDVLELMSRCGMALAQLGWTLRSGAAPGADEAFETGCKLARKLPVRKEIYLPWASFQSHPDPYLTTPKDEAFDIAAKYHPAWQYLKRPVKMLMARNVHQVLGRDLNDPVRMCVCWTPDGSLDGRGPDSGGTGMALRVIAGEAPSALVFNLARDKHRETITALCEDSSSDCVTRFGETS